MLNILIVDSDTTTIRTLKNSLKSCGDHSFFTATNNADALKILNNNPIHMVITEWIVEQTDSSQLCRQIRSNKHNAPYIYVIILTTKGEKQDRLAAYDAGIDMYLTKPPYNEELVAVVKAGMRIVRKFIKIQSETVAATKPATPVEEIDRREVVLARLALDNKLVTKKQLAEAFSIQHKRKIEGQYNPIGEILLEKEIISMEQLNELQVAQKRKLDKQFGIIAVNKRMVSKEKVAEALKIQAHEFKKTQTYRRTGDILVQMGVMTAEARGEIRMELQKPKSSPVPEPAPAIPKKQEVFHLKVSDGRLEAYLSKIGESSDPIPVVDLKAFLNENNVRYGIADDQQIEKFLNRTDNASDNFLVASGESPVEGVDAHLKYYFEKDYLRAGDIMEDGHIDFRERGDVPKVKAGDLIVEKIPAKAGTPGTDVYGNSILVGEPEDVNIKCEQGTILSDDGLKVYAKFDGQPNVTVGGGISVFSGHNIPGDVGYETGNIDYNGNINVKGTIQDGFTVKGGTLTAGEIQRATIHVKGDVVVAGGIFGANIQAEGRVIAKFVKDANIKAYGDVIILKEILDSKIRTSSECKSEKIVSSFVGARLGVTAREIGTDVSAPCMIKIGVDDHIRKIIEGFERTGAENRDALEKKQAEYDKLLQQQINFHEVTAETAKKHSDQQSQLDEKIDTIHKRMEKIIERIEDLNQSKAMVILWSKRKKGIVSLKVAGTIHAGTKISGPHASLILIRPVTNATFREQKVSEFSKDWEIKKI